MLDLGQTQALEIQDSEIPDQSFQTIFSTKEAVQAIGGNLLGLIFEGGGFDEMAAGSGFGPLLKGAKPIMKKKAIASLQTMTDEQAAWVVDQIHRLSASIEDLTNVNSPYHYGEAEVSE